MVSYIFYFATEPFMAPYTNKGYAVKELCSYLQINMDDVYTIGDRKLIYLCLIP
ncbi:hypothetical protein D1E88_14355 (plasmid) [Staphylococcus aureus]|nr:hypothetical protein D1E88_14355 [Staphylococcus aureus]